jgi:hypothetical protein
MNSISIWLSENKLVASLAAAFILFSGVTGWMTDNAWDAYSTASQGYIDSVAKLSNLNQQNPFPSEANKTQLASTLVKEQSEAESLIKSLQKYRVPSFKDLEKAKPQDRPQLFQDALRRQVTAIKAVATSKGVTMPLGFYLGLEEYENRPPSPEEATGFSKQLTVLTWIAEKLVARDGLILSEFSRELPPTTTKNSETPKKLPPATIGKSKAMFELIGSMRASFRCDQSSLYELVNEISSSPYFLLIETIQLQNSVAEPPRRSAPSQQGPQIQGNAVSQNQVQRLPIIVGRELINVSLKIRSLEFPAPEKRQPPSPTQGAK